MDAYLFQAAYQCQDCILDMLAKRDDIAQAGGKTASELLDEVKLIYGYASESDYDSDELPKGPFENGGGEADTPQHCDECSVFLANPLTPDGYNYVREQIEDYRNSHGQGSAVVLCEWLDDYGEDGVEPIAQGQISVADFHTTILDETIKYLIISGLIEHARTGEGNPLALKRLAAKHQITYVEPQMVSLADLEGQYNLLDDTADDARGVWFDIAGELYERGAPIPEEWKYSPGLSAVNRDSLMALDIAGAPTPVLMEFADKVMADIKRCEARKDAKG